MHRRRFALVYVLLAVILGGSGYGAFLGATAGSAARHRAPKRTCTAPQVGADPMLTAAFFIHTAVERADPGAGFALATPGLRGSTTCADWRRGKLPVAPYRNIDWKRAEYRIETRGSAQIVLQVLLASKLSPAHAHFLLELRHVGTVWRVGFWGPPALAA